MSIFEKFVKDFITTTTNYQTTNDIEKGKINIIEKELESLNKEINAAYTQIGRRYLEYIKDNEEIINIGVNDVLMVLDPKLDRKDELDKELIAIQKRMKDQLLIQEKNKLEEEFKLSKEKLDRALTMEVISQEEYNEKVNNYRKRLDNFEKIKKIEQQYELDIITREERDCKIDELLR